MAGVLVSGSRPGTGPFPAPASCLSRPVSLPAVRLAFCKGRCSGGAAVMRNGRLPSAELRAGCGQAALRRAPLPVALTVLREVREAAARAPGATVAWRSPCGVPSLRGYRRGFLRCRWREEKGIFPGRRRGGGVSRDRLTRSGNLGVSPLSL